MLNLSKFNKIKSIFFIGIGGISMSALALFFKNANYKVGGSDIKFSNETDTLTSNGVTIFIGHNASNIIGYDAIVYTSAISSDNPELLTAKKLGLKIFKRSEILGEITKLYKNSIAVCGSHGKTTTTTLIYRALNYCNLCPTGFIGGISDNESNYQKGNKDYLVLEACEYKKNFLDIKPTVSVVLNIDDDHVDTFTSSEDRENTFSEFAKNTICLYNYDDKACKNIKAKNLISFGLYEGADYRAVYIRKNKNAYSFTVKYKNKALVRINLKLEGKYNIYNALSAVSVAHYFGLDLKLVKRAIESFGGVKRRNEYLGKIESLNSYADYAHHPSEIKAYLSSKKEILDKTIVVFQPHTYSRTKTLKENFVSSLLGQHDLIIYKTYPAREKFDYSGSAYSLYKAIKKIKANTFYAKNDKELLSIIIRLKSTKQNLLILGAGDLYDIIKKV